jgi:hypothetical protein
MHDDTSGELAELWNVLHEMQGRIEGLETRLSEAQSRIDELEQHQPNSGCTDMERGVVRCSQLQIVRDGEVYAQLGFVGSVVSLSLSCPQNPSVQRVALHAFPQNACGLWLWDSIGRHSGHLCAREDGQGELAVGGGSIASKLVATVAGNGRAGLAIQSAEGVERVSIQVAEGGDASLALQDATGAALVLASASGAGAAEVRVGAPQGAGVAVSAGADGANVTQRDTAGAMRFWQHTTSPGDASGVSYYGADDDVPSVGIGCGGSNHRHGCMQLRGVFGPTVELEADEKEASIRIESGLRGGFVARHTKEGDTEVVVGVGHEYQPCIALNAFGEEGGDRSARWTMYDEDGFIRIQAKVEGGIVELPTVEYGGKDDEPVGDDANSEEGAEETEDNGDAAVEPDDAQEAESRSAGDGDADEQQSDEDSRGA